MSPGTENCPMCGPASVFSSCNVMLELLSDNLPSINYYFLESTKQMHFS